MKIAISGKGGVGKTTIAGITSIVLVKMGFKVLAIDADPSPNLAYVLGISGETGIVPIAENVELIKEKTGVEPGAMGTYFRLTFTVDDIVERFAVRSPDGVNLLVMGTVKHPGGGCMCPAHAVVRALMRHLLVERDEFVVMDMEAGVEHLKRGTAENVDALITVVEPYPRALRTAVQINRLARELGIKRTFIVGNKVGTEADVALISKFCEKHGLSLLSLIPFDEAIMEAELTGSPPTTYGESRAVEAVRGMVKSLIKRLS